MSRRKLKINEKGEVSFMGQQKVMNLFPDKTVGELVCSGCKKHFTGRVKWQKFCSDKCRNSFHYTNTKEVIKIDKDPKDSLSLLTWLKENDFVIVAPTASKRMEVRKAYPEIFEFLMASDDDRTIVDGALHDDDDTRKSWFIHKLT